MSAVLKDVLEFDSEQLAQGVEQWIASEKLDLFVMLTAFYDARGSFSRQNIFFSPPLHSDRNEMIVDGLQKDASLELTSLDLKLVTKTPLSVFAFRQGNVKPSRKQLQPLVEELLTKSKV